MAWRDTRFAKRKLLLFALAVVSGVAALVAINSFRANLSSEMDRQALSLLGADVEYESRQPFSAESLALIGSVPSVEQARKIELATMAYFPRQNDSRLVMTHAMEGTFPWYGTLDTKPAGLSVAGSPDPIALVEDSLMIQFELEVGDPLKIGETTFRIVGEMLRLPGEGSFTGSFAPRVLIPLGFLESTGLMQYGSRLEHVVYQRFPDGLAVESLRQLSQVRERLEELSVDVDTVEDQKRQIGRTLETMNSFLSMVGFVALLLGGIAIAGAVSVYLKAKSDAVATLRCLGASAGRAMTIYCIQISIVGLLGCLAGVALGVGLQLYLPTLVSAFLPLELEVSIVWSSILQSLAFGWLFTTLFALLPLLPLRRVSPLRAIRASFEASRPAWRDKLFLLVAGMLLALMVLFTISQTRNLGEAGAFLGGILLAIGLLAGLGVGLRSLLRRLSFRSLPFVWRQGLANLYRPNNRTTLLIVTLGMGTFLIFTIYVSERSLLQQGDLLGSGEQPNVIFFDIQPDQVEGVEELVAARSMEMGLAEPIVTMRLVSLNGQSAESLREDKSKDVERWATRREYRSTFRGFVREDEELVAGSFTAVSSLEGPDPVPISVEERIVEALKLRLGDQIVWDVQGLPVDTIVTSIRKVDWRQMKANFFVLFPSGVLEAAPAFYITAVKAPDNRGIVELQSDVVQRYPNVSAVNLTLILESLQAIFDKIGFVVRFMASFTIVTGLVALMASVLTSRYQRLRESALLRTIGASSSQIRGIMAIEYALLGVIGGLAGAILSLGASWALAQWFFKVALHLPWAGTLATVALVAVLTLCTGMLNSLGIARNSPMESIRQDAA